MAPGDSIETLLDQAQALMDEGDFARAILFCRRAQALAPFRQDIRSLLAEAIDGRLMTSTGALDADFDPRDFSETRAAEGRVRRHRRPSQVWGFAMIIGAMVIVLVGTLLLMSALQGGERGGGEPDDLASLNAADEGDSSDPAETPPPVPQEISAADLTHQAEVSLGDGQLQEALALAEEARVHEGADIERINRIISEVHRAQGQRRYNDGQYQRALSEYETALEHDAQNALTQYSIGWCHHELGRDARISGNEDEAIHHFQLARRAFEQSIALDESLTRSHRSLGQILILLDDREGAFRAWRHTIEIDPRSDDAERARAFLQSFNARIPEG
ncbi:tetratricopeptide repeat protein [Candidatus Sumerlaeota bacterium]|nr:tetratricopeptide repeat protein [Candidatus Sumerlaeota bacterium]